MYIETNPLQSFNLHFVWSSHYLADGPTIFDSAGLFLNSTLRIPKIYYTLLPESFIMFGLRLYIHAMIACLICIFYLYSHFLQLTHFKQQ